MARTFGYLKLTVAGCLFCALASCGSNFGFPGVYRINVEQGNVVNAEMIEKLRPGLNKRQVRYIMGTPLIEDSFHEDRWDYRYLLRNGTETIAETRLTLWFDGEELARVEGPDAPEWAVSDATEADLTDSTDADVTETAEADLTDTADTAL